MQRAKIALREGWRISARFRYVRFAELAAADREFVLSGVPYRLVGHAREYCWLYPVRADGRLTLAARRVRLDVHPRELRKVKLLATAEADACLAQARRWRWESWGHSGARELKLSKGYYAVERLSDLRARLLRAFGAEAAPATPLGVVWMPPGAYDKSHYHDTDVAIVALSLRDSSGGLEIKRDGRWIEVPYDIGEAVLIPKYIDHRVRPTRIDRFTATVTILN